MVQDLANHKAWLETIRPRLEKKINNSWIDPRKTTDEKDFFFQYTVAWAAAQAADEILKMVDGYTERVKNLRAKQEEEDSYRIGQ